MAMSEGALAQKIKEMILDIRTEIDNPDQSMEQFCEKLAAAIVSEVRKITIVATAPNGPVTVQSVE